MKNEQFEVGDKVIFVYASDEQVEWGSNDDPRILLEKDKVYEIETVEEHRWHTKLYLVGVKGKFNSVHFKLVDEPHSTDEKLNFLIEAEPNILDANIVDIIDKNDKGLLLTVGDNDEFEVEFQICISKKELLKVIKLMK